MALIKCNECGKEISDKAESCPNCGYKVKNNNKRVKKTGAIVTLVASSIFVILFILMLLSELTPTQENPEYSNTSGGITIGAPQNKKIISRDITLWLNWTFMLCPVIITILSILYLAKYKPSKKMYGIISLILSILWLFTVVIFISKANFGCCYIIFIINPIISTIGSILTLIELMGEQKNEIKENNE